MRSTTEIWKELIHTDDTLLRLIKKAIHNGKSYYFGVYRNLRYIR